MSTVIDLIATAIFRQEGMGPTYTNPGNLRRAPWLTNVEIDAGFWRPRSRAEGVAGAIHVIALAIARGKSLKQLIYQWAPPNENKTRKYLSNVSMWTGITDVDKPLWDFLEY